MIDQYIWVWMNKWVNPWSLAHIMSVTVLHQLVFTTLFFGCCLLSSATFVVLSFLWGIFFLYPFFISSLSYSVLLCISTYRAESSKLCSSSTSSILLIDQRINQPSSFGVWASSSSCWSFSLKKEKKKEGRMDEWMSEREVFQWVQQYIQLF